MPSPTFYAYWEAKFGVRVAVKDSPTESRVAVWSVPVRVQEAAKPFVAAIDAKNQEDIMRTSGAYHEAVRDLKPPAEGAEVIGYLSKLDQGWLPLDKSRSQIGEGMATAAAALDHVVATWTEQSWRLKA